jgi:hypothetical protein
MRLVTVLMLVLILAASTFYFFISIGEVNLGLIMSVIMFCWPIGLWGVSRMGGSKQPMQIAEERPTEMTQETIQETAETAKERVQLTQADVNALKESLAKLRSVTTTIEDEKKQGIISDKTYDDLICQNKAAIDRLEKELHES